MSGNSRNTGASARKGTGKNGQLIIKDSLFPISLFAIYLGVLLPDVRASRRADCIYE